jgi:peroxiredoxin
MNRFGMLTRASSLAMILCVACAGCEHSAPKENLAKDATTAGEHSAPVKNTANKPISEPEPVAAAAEKHADKPAAAPSESTKPQTEIVVDKVPAAGAGILTADPLDSPNPVVPVVAMSDQHAATCLIKVGDAMPAAILPDINGEDRDLGKLLGERLTIVLFWTPENRSSVDELGELAAKIASALHARGVRVVGVCEQGTAETAKSIAEAAGASFPIMLDNDGAFMSHVATSKLPRTYLLDPSGKILWFDIEYSRAMWQDLRTSLRALLPDEPTMQ